MFDRKTKPNIQCTVSVYRKMSLPIPAETYVSGKSFSLMLKIVVIILIIPTSLSSHSLCSSLLSAANGVAAGAKAAGQGLGQLQHSFGFWLHHEDISLYWGDSLLGITEK